MQPKAELVSLASGAAYLGVDPRTLRRYISAGRIRAFRVGPRMVRVDRADLEALKQPIPTCAGGAA